MIHSKPESAAMWTCLACPLVHLYQRADYTAQQIAYVGGHGGTLQDLAQHHQEKRCPESCLPVHTYQGPGYTTQRNLDAKHTKQTCASLRVSK